MVIRDARVEDMPQIMALCHRALADAFYKHLPMDEGAVRRQMLYCLSSQAQFLQVVEIDGQLEGMLAGTAEKVWHSTKKQASDLVFYTTDKGRGAGSLLARRFLRWARQRPGVQLIGISVSYGGTNVKRTGKMLEKLGLTYVGGIYMEARKNEQPTEVSREGNQADRTRTEERGVFDREGSQESVQVSHREGDPARGRAVLRSSVRRERSQAQFSGGSG
jgi:hypothetical protein